MRFERGLVVGKFAPLHRGHELVIRRALDECGDVIVLTYSVPEIEGCEPHRRERWLGRLFPQAHAYVVTPERLAQWFAGREPCALPDNDAPATAHREFCARLLREVIGLSVDAVFTSEAYGDGFAADLTALLGRRKPVAHVCVDAPRQAVPISASAIRADVHAARCWLSPVVYADFVERIALLGGESSGKSVLAPALAAALHTTFTTEYGRDLWIERGGVLAYDELLHIAQAQIRMEQERAQSANRYLVCDTSPLTTLLYCLDLFGRAEPGLERRALRPYVLQVLCAPDFPFVQDGWRRDDAYRRQQHEWYLQRLRAAGRPWIEVGGSVEERVAAVMRHLARRSEGARHADGTGAM